MTTEELQAKVVEAERHLNELVAEDTALDQEQQRIDERVKYIYNRKRELRPVGYNHPVGLIARAQTELTELKQALLDSAHPQLTINALGGEIQFVLSKVTPKQIYLRQVGTDAEVIVSKDGKRMPWSWNTGIEEIRAFAGVKE